MLIYAIVIELDEHTYIVISLGSTLFAMINVITIKGITLIRKLFPELINKFIRP